ncbi:MAG: heme-binding protein [Pseudomonadota bacterium]
MSNVTLAAAEQIVDAALAEGRALGLNPLTVVVLDGGGHLVACKREDNSSIMRPQVATGKAWGCLAMGESSRSLGDKVVERPHFGTAISVASEGRLVPVPGGVLIRDAAGTVIGAVGISGDVSDADERCAIVGVRAAGLTPEPAEPA